MKGRSLVSIGEIAQEVVLNGTSIRRGTDCVGGRRHFRSCSPAACHSWPGYLAFRAAASGGRRPLINRPTTPARSEPSEIPRSVRGQGPATITAGLPVVAASDLRHARRRTMLGAFLFVIPVSRRCSPVTVPRSADWASCCSPTNGAGSGYGGFTIELGLLFTGGLGGVPWASEV